MEYKEKFELLSERLGEVSDAVLEGNFMKGMKPKIRAALRLLRPRGLGETMELAQMIEDKNTAKQINKSNSVSFSYRNSIPLVGQKTQTFGFQREFQSIPPGGQKTQIKGIQRDFQRDRGSGARSGATFKRLTETQIQDKRTKGLCFRCDEKFSPGHRCKDKSLHVLTVCDEEEGGGEAEEEEVEEQERPHLDVAEVSLNSVVGFTLNHKMKIRGRIGEQDVVVLIDSGATHNFISNKVVDRLGLCLTDIGSFGVVMGTGKVEKSRGICRGLILLLPGVQVVENFLPLDLGSIDVILGIKWLQTLGEMKVNWKLLTMEFRVNSQVVVLRGDSSLSKTFVSLKTMIKVIQDARQGFLVELYSMVGGRTKASTVIPEPIQQLLEQFEGVFHMPSGLPPR